MVPEHFHQQRCWHQADGLLRPGEESGRLGAPFGTTAREILEDYAGGMRDGLKFKARQPGGAGTDFLTEAHLDPPMEFESIGKAGSRLGTSLAMAVDHEINMVSLVRNLKSSLPASPAAGVRRAAMVCRGA